MMVGEEEAIAGKDAAAVGGALIHAVIGGGLHEAAESLDGRLVTIPEALVVLRKCRQRDRRDPQGQHQNRLFAKHIDSFLECRRSSGTALLSLSTHAYFQQLSAHRWF